MPILDDGHDLIRAVILLVNSLNAVFLFRIYRARHARWTIQERDSLVVMTLWTASALFLSAEGVYRDTGFGYRLIFILIASLVTLHELRLRDHRTR